MGQAKPLSGDRAGLTGLRVLVVEDMYLVADVIDMVLQEHGCRVVGPVPRLQRALELARAESLDGAILDVNLAGELSFPVAAALAERGIPFFFLTGYDDAALFPPEYRSHARLMKPFDDDALERMAAREFAHAP